MLQTFEIHVLSTKKRFGTLIASNQSMIISTRLATLFTLSLTVACADTQAGSGEPSGPHPQNISCDPQLEEVPEPLSRYLPQAGETVRAFNTGTIIFSSGWVFDTDLSDTNLAAIVGAEVFILENGDVELRLDDKVVAVFTTTPLANAFIDVSGATTDAVCGDFVRHFHRECGQVFLDRYAFVLGDTRVEPGEIGVIGSGDNQWQVNNEFVVSRLPSGGEECADLWPTHSRLFAVRVTQ